LPHPHRWQAPEEAHDQNTLSALADELQRTAPDITELMSAPQKLFDAGKKRSSLSPT